MKTNHSLFTRRGFVKRGLLFLPSLYLPVFGDNPILVEQLKWTPDGGDGGSVLSHIPRGGGLQAQSVIKARTISSVVDNRMQLNNSSCARLWSSTLGTSWTKIRVGFRASITDSGANLTSVPKFVFGIQSGTTVYQATSGPTHWFGFYPINTTWPRTTSGGFAIYQFGNDQFNSIHSAKKVGTTITDLGGNLGANFSLYLEDSTQAKRGMMFIEIGKVDSTHFSAAIFYKNTTGSDVTSATFLAQMVLTTPAVTDHIFSTNFASSVSVNEAADGYMNAVSFGWDHADALIEISDVTIVRLA